MTEIGEHTWPDDLNPATMTATDSDGLALLRCPQCGARLLRLPEGGIACEACDTAVATSDGIVDFVAGASGTELDNIDYDAFYRISPEAALNLYGVIRASAGPLWPPHLGDALEIGCGTGGFTMAVLRECPADRVVLTDISLKMVRLCRERLARTGGLRAEDMTFVTYSGTESCFAPGAFDTCYGTAVLHHVTDVPRILGDVQRLLKPHGRAFFMEPNLPFHRALTLTLASILDDWVRNETVPEPDISRMLNWMGEVHCNIVNSGDTEVLSEREDKHLFVGGAFEAMAEAAGFQLAHALPCGPDPTGVHTIGIYLAQCGVSDYAMDRLKKVWPAAQAACFADLKPQDRAPSYLFWLEKVARRRAVRRVVTDAVGAEVAGGSQPFRLWLRLARDPANEAAGLLADGWCVAVDRVKSVQINAGGGRTRIPIWLPRPDVHLGINAAGGYPALHALCSGFEGRVLLGAAKGMPVQVKVDLVTADDRIVPVGTAMLTASDCVAMIEV